jgi:hypothetical protein
MSEIFNYIPSFAALRREVTGVPHNGMELFSAWEPG